MRVCGSGERAWRAEFDELAKTGWDSAIIHEFLQWRENAPEQAISKKLSACGAECITRDDQGFPPLLARIYDPPIALFVRGAMSPGDNFLAVVGPRKHSDYGRHMTEMFVSALCKAGITIVSGMAYGIDAIAHEAALSAGGKTVAVLGSGVDDASVYPAAHVHLARRIMENGGAVVSEYPPGTRAAAYHFPARNRIVAGMSLGTLLIEAGEKSGALITAQCAIEEGREVFVLPQNITSRTSRGSNELLKYGAHPVTGPDDVLSLLNIQTIAARTKPKNSPPSDKTEAAILSALNDEPSHIDDIARRAGLSVGTVGSALTLMELSGSVRNLGGMKYVAI